MAKKFQLQIPEPCHEDWNKMTVADKSRFCGSCQKTVIDFTGMSDAQLVAFFKKPSTGSVCGRFIHDQLDRDIAIPRKRIPWLKYFFQFAIPVFLTSLKSSAQGKIVIKDQVEVCKISEERPVDVVKGQITEELPGSVKTIKGKVVDEMGMGIPYASVVIKGTKSGVMTNAEGGFIIKPFKENQTSTLVFSSIGFDTKELILDKKTNDSELNVGLVPMTGTLAGEIVIVGFIAPRKKKEPVPSLQRIIKDTAFKFFKAYPNPVASGSSIKIELKKAKAGEYQLDLLNQNGQAVYSSILNFESESQVSTINIPSVAAGTYFIRMTNKKFRKQHTEKIIVQ